MRPRILIVDDEASLLQFLRLLFEEADYDVTTAGSVAAARELLDEKSFHVALCDLTMPEGSGLDVLQYIQQDTDCSTVAIIMTAYSSTESAIEAMKLGAYDYISKPFDVEELKLLVQKALEKSELYDENEYLRRELRSRYTFSNIIGKSRLMREVFSLVERVARTPSTVLIRGESGTGKELIARAIHFNSPRSASRFLSINCGALPENLLESELFGHERGAFTGAVRDKQGLFQEAHGGTLFLDEIGEMSPPMQVKLLRALQEKVVRRVGGTKEEATDARIVAATNRNLEESVDEGTFREDLFYRINVIPIRIPPLRHRREDIPLLVGHFIRKYTEELELEPVRFNTEAMKILEGYSWPGNVRELENVVERTLALCSGSTVGPEDLPSNLTTQQTASEIIALPTDGLDLEAFLENIRKQLMSEALERTGWIQTQAAELVGMSFRSFRYYAKKSGLTGRRDDDASEESLL